MSLTAAIRQNTITLSYLKEKDYGQAVTSSLTALAHLRSSESLNRPQSPTTKSSTDNLVDQCMLLSPSCKDEETDANQMFIYDQGILLPQNTTDFAIITPALIFNAALSHHLAAHARGAFAQDLQSAKRLYELAYGSQTVALNTLFRFVVINNIAVIDRQLGNAEQSEFYIKQLMSVLMLLVDQKRSAELQQLRGFLVNVRTSSTTASAA